MPTMRQQLEEAAKKARPVGPAPVTRGPIPTLKGSKPGTSIGDGKGNNVTIGADGNPIYTDANGNTSNKPNLPQFAKPAQVISDQQIAADNTEKAQQQLQQENDQAEQQRKKGRLATLLTGSTGLLSTPATSRKTLLGY